MEQSQHFDKLLLDDHEKRIEPRVTEKLFGHMFEEGLKAIWNWLVTDNLSTLGIYGQGGIGKTTLAKHIYNHLLEKTYFNVYWVTVPQEFSIKKLQDDIAKLMKLYLPDEDDEDQRAAKLSRSLVQKSVLILDGVQEEFCPEKIGIFLGTNKCRLILTTRLLQLCHKMHCEREFNVTTLDTNEAWDLFKHTVGLGTVLAPEVEEVAKLVAEICAGLPLGIIIVAGSMKGVIDIREWRNALEQLRTSSIGYREMEDKVFPILEWSFNRLNGCERLCFLYCCLYPENEKIKIEELIDLFILAELTPRQKNREVEVDHGHTILNKLIKACLLEEAKNDHGENCVKMHDLIRDMTLRIASGESAGTITGDVARFLVKNREGRSILDQNEWIENLNAVSFFGQFGCIEFPSGMSPKCPNLSILCFNFIEIETIPDSFFRHMNGLKVLNLKHCKNLKELPNCISNMVNLTALLLSGCLELESVPPLRKLTQLRELDLSDTGIDDVPQGLEELVKLERLYMKGTRMKSKIIPKETFSKLHHLQHLTFPLWVHLKDLEVFKQLQVFKGQLASNHFISSHCWPKYYNIFIVEGPRRYIEDIHEIYLHSYKEQKALKFIWYNFQQGSMDVVLLPEDITELTFDECFGLSNVFLQRLINRSKDLSRLLISCSEEVQFLLNLSSPPDHALESSNFVAPLQNLQSLTLDSLPNLVELINWRSSSSSIAEEEAAYFTRTFHSLTRLHIYRCHKLKKLFTVRLLQQSLQNLQELYVYHCKQLEEIIANDDNDEDDGVKEETTSGVITFTAEVRLPKLERMQLKRLPRLKNICKERLICQSIEQIWINSCPKVKRLPLFLSINTINGQPFPPKTLREIRGSEEWWDSLAWDNSNARDALQPFLKEEIFF